MPGTTSLQPGPTARPSASASRSQHAKFIENNARGGTLVLTVDSLKLPLNQPIAIKIDVEGDELAVLQGAAKTLANVPAFVVQIEANWDVIQRTGIDSSIAVDFIRSIRKVACKVINDDAGVIGSDVRSNVPFFDQFPGHQSCDIVLSSL